MSRLRTLRDLELHDRKVLLRVDFNVPLSDGAVTDDSRIQAALPTILYLLDHGAAVILCSHLGRPKGAADPSLSLRPVGRRLAELVGRPVEFVEDCIGPAVVQAASQLAAGQLLLLENTRFHPGEKSNDPEFAGQLAALADAYVDDAFGSAHRAHASTEGVAHLLPSAAGLLIEKELKYLSQALENPERPYLAVLGGAKISDKMGVIGALLERTDRLLIGGGMANTFLAAQGFSMGRSLVEPAAIETAAALRAASGDRLLLPSDLVVAADFSATAERRTVEVGAIPAEWMALDIGPETAGRFAEVLATAKTVVWNGPMGVFELPPFAAGTDAVARAIADSGALSIVGGGDSVAAVQAAGLADRFSHLSTGGGASLAVLEGQTLPGIAVLQQ